MKTRCSLDQFSGIKSSKGFFPWSGTRRGKAFYQTSQTDITLTVFALSDRYKLSPRLSLWDLQSGLICTFRMQHKGHLIKDKTMNALWCSGLGTGLGDPALEQYLTYRDVTLLGRGVQELDLLNEVWRCNFVCPNS